MIGSFLKLTALAAAAAILALTIRKQTPELSLALTAAACCAVCLLALPFVKPVLELARRLSEKTGLAGELTAALWKTAGISLLSGICAAVCEDAGQSALSRLVQSCGGLLCLCLSLPLLEAALALMEKLL